MQNITECKKLLLFEQILAYLKPPRKALPWAYGVQE